MSTMKIEAALNQLGRTSTDLATDERVAAALNELVALRHMCRTFKGMGIGAFRDLEKAEPACRTLDAVAAEYIPSAAELQMPRRAALAPSSSGDGGVCTCFGAYDKCVVHD